MWNLKFAFRSLKKSWSITLINILGFSLGLSAIFFLTQYLVNEYSYDSFHKDGDRIYRAAIKYHENGEYTGENFVYTSEVGKDLKTDFPQVEDYVTVSTPIEGVFYKNDAPTKIKDYRYASKSFFDLFSFQLKQGNPQKVLEAPYTMVLTESLSHTLYGNQNPMGKQLKFNEEMYTITGVAVNPPKNTDIGFNMLLSFSTRYKQKNVYVGWKGGNQYVHYMKMVPGTNPIGFGNKTQTFMWKNINKEYEDIGVEDELYFQPLSRIHLSHNPDSASLRKSMIVFSAIAVLLLAIVIINFVNLFVANAGKQIKTMGIVKVHGASKANTIKLILLQISMMIMVSMVLALFIVQGFHGYFEALAGKSVPTLFESGSVFVMLLVGIVVLTTFMAAVYPSLMISSVQSLKIIKNELVMGSSGMKLKNFLVVFQFVVSIFLIVAAVTSEKQLRFMQRFDTGYDRENVLVLPLNTNEMAQKSELLKQEIGKIPEVIGVSAVSQVPYNGLTRNGYFPEGRNTPEMVNVIDVDENFLSLLELSLTEGDNFSKDMVTDDNAYLVNAAFVIKMGWASPIGKNVQRNGDHKIIGVVKDFNFASLRSTIQPLIITNRPESGSMDYLLVKSEGHNLSRTIKDIEAKWDGVSSKSLFEYRFLDQQFEQVYKAELSMQKLLQSFSVLAILIALMGLLGLSKSAISQRVKEIGIRKVNGATVKEVLLLLNKSYIILILIAFLIAVPLAWLAMQQWLQDFAYKTELSWWVFVFAGGVTILITLATVSWHSYRAATANPVDALRNE